MWVRTEKTVACLGPVGCILFSHAFQPTCEVPPLVWNEARCTQVSAWLKAEMKAVPALRLPASFHYLEIPHPQIQQTTNRKRILKIACLLNNNLHNIYMILILQEFT